MSLGYSLAQIMYGIRNPSNCRPMKISVGFQRCILIGQECLKSILTCDWSVYGVT